ncbi:MAG TPA: exosortase H-associated membrane protein [Casimicrobiaceae bacterium]|nr:exosortase H-associated membrane protein [Casimicrobiaceae bacterium]
MVASPGRFILRVAAWLPLAFLLWYIAAPLLAWPVALLTTAVAKIGFSSIVDGVEQQGRMLTIVSTLKSTLASTQNAASGVLSVDLNPGLYSFGFPMLVALTLAARQPHMLRTLLLGYVVLTPFVSWGLVAEFLKRIAFDAGPTVASQAGFTPAQREAIAFAYQFGTLILPAAAPAVFWVLTHRRFLAEFANRGAETLGGQ